MPADSKTPELDPIDAAYRVALLMTGDSAAAASLVDAAVSRLRKEHPPFPSGIPGELDILRMMWRLRRETQPNNEPGPQRSPGLFAAHRQASAMARVRSKIIALLDNVRPDALSVLYLVEVRGLSVDSTAGVSGMTPVEVMSALQEGLAAVHDAVFASSDEGERSSIIEDLPDSWLRDALGQVIDDLDTVPEPLRQAVYKASAGTPSNVGMPPVTGPLLPRDKARAKQPTVQFRALIISVILILGVGFGARFLYDRFATTHPERNAIALAMRHADRFTPDLETASPDRARRYLITHLGENVPLPEISDAPLTGTAIGEIAAGSRVAVLRYQDRSTGQPITVYALTYRFLDEHAGRIDLSSDVRRQIQSETNFDLHDLGSVEVLVWRHRSYVLMAVTSLDARTLRERIQVLTESTPAP